MEVTENFEVKKKRSQFTSMKNIQDEVKLEGQKPIKRMVHVIDVGTREVTVRRNKETVTV